MKRELKPLIPPRPVPPRPWIAEPIPMKRELKLKPVADIDTYSHIAEPIPMKRELKPAWRVASRYCDQGIAEPIPMKRELKRR